MKEYDNIWEKTIQILTFWKDGKIISTQKKIVKNGMTDSFIAKDGEIDEELNNNVETWIKVRTQKYFLNFLDSVLKSNRDGVPVGSNSSDKGWFITIEEKKSIRDKFLDSTNDLWRDFSCLLTTVGIVVKKSLILFLTPKMQRELKEHDSENINSDKS